MVVLVGGVVGYGVASGKMHGDSISVQVDGEEVHHTSIAKVIDAGKARRDGQHGREQLHRGRRADLLRAADRRPSSTAWRALYDDRRDRSILFWKSLPISDTDTVLSKLLTVLVVAPLITIGVATAAALAILFFAGIATSSHGVNLFGAGADQRQLLPGAALPGRHAAGLHPVGLADRRLAAAGVELGEVQGLPLGHRRAAVRRRAPEVARLPAGHDRAGRRSTPTGSSTTCSKRSCSA